MIVVFETAITLRCQQLICDVKKHVILLRLSGDLVILSEITDQETCAMPNSNGFSIS